GGTLVEVARPVAVALLPAVAFHLLLGLPDGDLGTRGRRWGVAVGYGAGALVGLALWTQHPRLPVWPVVLEVALVALVGGPASNRRYRGASAVERQRLQWIGCAVAVLVEASLVIAAF